MTNLRSAAERLRKHGETERGEAAACDSPYYDWTEEDFDDPMRRFDVELVAKAILAQHPADDDEPVTEEWLRSIGFEAYGPFNDLQIKLPSLVDGFNDWLRVGDNIGEGDLDFGNALWTVWNYERRTQRPDGATLSCRPTTRRQVRQLLEVLGGGVK